MEFEYVTRAEYQPVRKELEDIIHRAQKYLREKYNISFQYRLVGSGKKHLITRVKDGNKGYDFDYDLILPNHGENINCSNKALKERFLEAFQYAVEGTDYKSPENSTSVITIKNVDRRESRILYSCDFAIIYYPTDNSDDGYMYLKNWKNGTYSFEIRELSRKAEQKRSAILAYPDGWNCIREEYLKVKNNNRDPDKRSSVLYLEAINNVYNQI